MERFDLIYLECHELNDGLLKAADEQLQRLLTRVVDDHRNENEGICAEFVNIKERALRRPENTEELMAMVSFVEMARSSGMVNLWNKHIRDCHERLNYLLDVHLFAAADFELNARVLTWPSAINPVFDENDELVEKCKGSGEKGLLERKEKLIAEIKKVRKRADELTDMGEMDRMAKYGAEGARIYLAPSPPPHF